MVKRTVTIESMVLFKADIPAEHKLVDKRGCLAQFVFSLIGQRGFCNNLLLFGGCWIDAIWGGVCGIIVALVSRILEQMKANLVAAAILLPDEEVLRYVYEDGYSVEQIARAMGYSSNYLAERFRSNFHIGISHYINTVRLKNALTLMRENKHTITECALESGFSSLRTFYRVFTQELGCTPKEYLKTE